VGYDPTNRRYLNVKHRHLIRRSGRRVNVNPSLVSPDRLAPAGLGTPQSKSGSVSEHAQNMTPDMERALGALRDFTRRDILLRFFADRKPRSVDDVARGSGVHRSVAFDHLERLVALGYLEVERRRGLPGKPAKIYRLTGGPLQISHPMRRYELLAEALAEALDDRLIKQAGRSLGRSLARPGVKSTISALEPLIEMGGDYELGPGGRIACLNCLFAEACRRVPSICVFHAGVIEGLTDSEVESRGYLSPSGCAYRVS
jgi:predicted ArsR family transcriptional regulator